MKALKTSGVYEEKIKFCKGKIVGFYGRPGAKLQKMNVALVQKPISVRFPTLSFSGSLLTTNTGSRQVTSHDRQFHQMLGRFQP
jgi:hypothetical protein